MSSLAVAGPLIGTRPAVLLQTAKRVAPPTFDLHKVAEALRTNHRLYNGIALTDAEITDAISQYRQFLADHKAAGAPDRFEVPSRLVDRVWHTHMCETQQYADDCQAYFGKFIHHRSEICDGGGAGQP